MSESKYVEYVAIRAIACLAEEYKRLNDEHIQLKKTIGETSGGGIK